MIFAIFFVNTNIAYANNYLSFISQTNTSKTNNIVFGSKEDLSSTTNKINYYLKYSDLTEENNIISENNKFISKPIVLETQSRAAIEEEKIKKEQEEISLRNAQLASYNRNVYYRESSNTTRNNTINTYHDYTNNSYYYGYCTWYVANKRNVPGLWGNAGEWLYNAQKSGYETSPNPADGSIIVTSESGWGHVGYVESVGEDTITISEMNYSGWGTVNTREIPKNSPLIKGFIY
jgi:surface antigen